MLKLELNKFWRKLKHHSYFKGASPSQIICKIQVIWAFVDEAEKLSFQNVLKYFIYAVVSSKNILTKVKRTIKFESHTYPFGIYLLRINNGNTRTRCEIFSKLTTKTPERRHWHRSAFFIINFERISHLVLLFLLLTLNM